MPGKGLAAAAVVSHHPGIMLPDRVRKRIPGGDFSMVAGFAHIRKRLAAKGVDTVRRAAAANTHATGRHGPIDPTRPTQHDPSD